MKRTGKIVCCVGLMLWLVTGTVTAETVEELYREQLQASGSEALLEALPDETRRLLETLRIDSLDMPQDTPAEPSEWLRVLASLAKTAAAEPLAACGTVLGIVLIYAWVDGTRLALRAEDSASVFGSVCALTACGALMIPVASQIERVQAAMTSVGVFMTSFIPVYAGVLVTGGQPSAALSFQSVVFYAAELLSFMAGSVIVPLLSVSLALGLTGSLTPDLRLGRVGAAVGKAATFLLTIGMVVFTGILSIQSLTGATADRLSDRALRFSISHFVPVVGGSLSESFATVRGCLKALRSTVGGFGVAATALIVLPPLVSCVMWNVTLSVGQIAADLFGLSSFSELMKTAHGIVRCMIGVLCVSGMLLTVAITVLTVTTGGTA